MKTIHDLDRKKGGRELKALRLLKNIRHPNLVPLTGFWLRSADGELLADAESPSNGPAASPDAQDARGTMVPGSEPLATLAPVAEAVELVIAMGLCESSLTDRLEECKAEGLRAVPFDELLTYMKDAARAIDLLNTKHDIQHCDIKPKNILLLSGAAQVADFGLAKMIGDIRESSMGAGTIAYGAPEVLLGAGPSHATDQYSLAISYYELRTGDLPFGSDLISEVLAAKRDGEIDLAILPPGEREVIGRATSVEPENRYANCTEMIRPLREHGSADIPLGSAVETDHCWNDHTVPLSRPAGRNKWLLPAASTAIAASLIVAVMLLLFGGSGEQVQNAQPDESPARHVVAGSDHVSDALSSNESAVTAAAVTSDAVGRSAQSFAADSEVEAHGSHDEPGTGNEGQLLAELETIESRIAESTAETAENTRRIAETIEQSAANGEQLAETAADISRTLGEIREQLALSADHSGLIQDPQNPSDFYHNARMFQQRGDYLNARRNYSQLLAFQLDVQDPHLEFQRILRIQDGTAAVREVYVEFANTTDNRATRLGRALAEAGSSRRQHLDEFVEAYPDYAPAIYPGCRVFQRKARGSGTRRHGSRERTAPRVSTTCRRRGTAAALS